MSDPASVTPNDDTAEDWTVKNGELKKFSGWAKGTIPDDGTISLAEGYCYISGTQYSRGNEGKVKKGDQVVVFQGPIKYSSKS
jgi:hypothetical protein